MVNFLARCKILVMYEVVNLAYQSEDYIMEKIGNYIDLHYSSVGKIEKKQYGEFTILDPSLFTIL